MFLTNGNWKSFPRVIMTLQHLRAGIAQSATRVKYSLETMRAEHWILNRDKLNRNHTMRIYAKYLDDVPSCNLKIRWRSSNFPSLLSNPLESLLSFHSYIPIAPLSSLFLFPEGFWIISFKVSLEQKPRREPRSLFLHVARVKNFARE